ncbi:disulfide bond formation protein B [Teichococcus aestuarii]|uniref:Disulfide bond formation protein B n=1 Tax=Teichococcus aestuarii TaxID=568898 RepID=A0A2U1UYW9_9PROT|nr:disulfide bond formation protein B [Pseudoroseomonas aestuarii]PWC26837.1 disulfide bond formation protein B [Pseudoroseomonas aestuarii]
MSAGKAGTAANSAAAGWTALFAAWVVALAASLSALYIGEVMGQVPCSLCWHQRAFMFPLTILLAVACYHSDEAAWRYAAPVAAIGWLIAGWHTLLFYGVVSEAIQPCSASGPSCSGEGMTLLGWVPLPALSLLAFTAILLLLLAVARGGRKA